MKKFFKILIIFILVIVLGLGLYRFWPLISARLFGNASTQWISQKLTESIQAQNELLVLNIETSGVETVTQEAWLIGTVQKVEIPYTFSMHYSVDMTKVQVSMNGTNIQISLPQPVPGYQKLVVDEENMKKSDFLMPLTASDYSKIKLELEDRIFREYAESTSCLEQAKEDAIAAVTAQYTAVLDKLFVNQVNPYSVSITFTEAGKV